MKLNAKFLTAAVLTTALISQAHACWETHGVGLGFGCEGDPVVPVPGPVRNVYKEIGKAPASAAYLCEQVGARCANQTFFQTFQALRAGKMAGMYQTEQDCVNTGYAVSRQGHQAASYIARAKGVDLPGELVNPEQMNNADISDACRVLFRG